MEIISQNSVTIVQFQKRNKQTKTKNIWDVVETQGNAVYLKDLSKCRDQSFVLVS